MVHWVTWEVVQGQFFFFYYINRTGNTLITNTSTIHAECVTFWVLVVAPFELFLQVLAIKS